MSRKAVLQLDPEEDGRVTIRFHDNLLSGEVIESATAVVQERTSENPEAWATAAGLTVDSAEPADAYADNGTTLLGADQAVQVTISDSDEDADTPARGTGYRVFVVATVTGRDVPLTAKNPLHIRP